MGVKNLSDIFKGTEKDIRKETSLENLKHTTIGIDAFNQLFQFMASIRDDRGSSMVDSEGRITSHLIGILTRNCVLLQYGIKPIYVFDGKSHPLKQEVQSRRREKRELAEEEYEKAVAEGDMVRAKTFARQMNRITSEIIEDSKELLDRMGIPWVDAPGEGEAQAAQMAAEGTVYATGSQDYDSMLFGSPKMVRNLNITGKRNTPSGRVIEIKPEEIELATLLDTFEITREQLVDLGILLGTDFNPDGITKVGPKTAFKWIKEYGSFEKVLKNQERVVEADIPYEVIRGIFLQPNVKKGVKFSEDLKFDKARILEFLVEERNFSTDRYMNVIDKTERMIDNLKNQTSLDDWF